MVCSELWTPVGICHPDMCGSVRTVDSSRDLSLESGWLRIMDSGWDLPSKSGWYLQVSLYRTVCPKKHVFLLSP